jgi:hypothetical protein
MPASSQGEIGRVLAERFTVTGPPLGEGASGVVHPARDQVTGRDVAVKVLHPHLARDQGALGALRLTTAGAAIQHAHIVGVVGLWADHERWLLVTERVEGIALSSLQGPMSVPAALSMALQLATAVAAAHDAGVVHGDVRAGNVLLGPGGAKLFDFGVARLAALGHESWTHPGWTAPEVVSGAAPSVASDLYGLGAVLYFALGLRPPYGGGSLGAVLAAQKEGVACLDVPRGVMALLDELLQPDPTRRPVRAADVVWALRRLCKRPSWRARTRRWIAPIRPAGPMVVHALDPQTGQPALVRSDLGARAARELVERLERDGWEVEASRVALGWSDLLIVGVVAIVASIAFPVVGTVLGLFAGLWWRSTRVRPELAEVLPPMHAAVPPRRAPEGAESMVVAGLLLLATAAALSLSPTLAVVPVAALTALAVWAFRQRTPALGEVARAARLDLLLTRVRAAIEQREHGVDGALTLLGELEEVQRLVGSGVLGVDRALEQATQLRERAVAAPLRSEQKTGRLLKAMRTEEADLDP